MNKVSTKKVELEEDANNKKYRMRLPNETSNNDCFSKIQKREMLQKTQSK
jgi:hypothetical protein